LPALPAMVNTQSSNGLWSSSWAASIPIPGRRPCPNTRSMCSGNQNSRPDLPWLGIVEVETSSLRSPPYLAGRRPTNPGDNTSSRNRPSKLIPNLVERLSETKRRTTASTCWLEPTAPARPRRSGGC
jgi:hypothetical protein